MTAKRILLTGSTGTLGHHLIQRLTDKPEVTVRALLRKHSAIPATQSNLQFCAVDFFNQTELTRAVREFHPDCVIHCAATGTQFPKPQWFDLIRFNVDVSLALCECVSLIPGCHFVYVSTGLAYRDQGRPLTESDALDTLHPYGASKAAADILVRSAAAEFGARATVARPFSFTGIGDQGTRLFPSLLRAAVENRPLELSAGGQIRDHCSAEDIADGILAAAFAPPPEGGIYNFGSGSPTPLRAVLEDVVNQLALPVDLKFGTRPYARFEPMFLVADTTNARTQLHWQPRKSLAHSVWRLAESSFPTLKLKEPKEWI